MSRWFLKCRTCKKPWAVDFASTDPAHVRPEPPDVKGLPNHIAEQKWRAYHWAVNAASAARTRWETGVLNKLRVADCQLCGAKAPEGAPYTMVHNVMGRVEKKRLVNAAMRCPCDGRCTGATGPNCECSCGGVNHGTGRLIAVEIDAGGVPRLVALVLMVKDAN